MMNIYEKMSEIMNTINYLGKDGQIDFGKTRYKAISEEKVTTMVRKELIKHKLVVFPTEQTSERIGNLTRVNVTYKMVNAENPEEFILIASSGEGADTQDKGVGKAMTYAYKYMLLRAFGIPTGEDPDRVSSDELTEKFDQEVKNDLLWKIEVSAEEHGVPVDKLLKMGGVKKLEDLPTSRLQNLLKALEQGAIK